MRYDQNLIKLGLEERDDSFCIFIFYGNKKKFRVLEEWAELVASQLTQINTIAMKIN